MNCGKLDELGEFFGFSFLNWNFVLKIIKREQKNPKLIDGNGNECLKRCLLQKYVPWYDYWSHTLITWLFSIHAQLHYIVHCLFLLIPFHEISMSCIYYENGVESHVRYHIKIISMLFFFCYKVIRRNERGKKCEDALRHRACLICRNF